MEQNLFRGQGVEIDLLVPDNFLKIKETLTRIGIASRRDHIIFQSCHILHKKDKETDASRYAIMHFKELFILDGKQNNLDEDDVARRNTIVNLLAEWGLLRVVNPTQTEDPIAPLNKIKVIAFKEKNMWKLESKYTVGVKKGR
jgi:hypothetical protein|tara:strand:- start:432 stop:860 length:429 start_codon:yes stop_codon:yes gene_type:complete